MADIHQEILFDASVAQVYHALTDSSTFAAWSEMDADISTEEGGPFSCFGIYILGRQIELVPDRRLIQAWRVFNWEEGDFSLVRFDLRGEGTGTRLVFDQWGVPDDVVEHVDRGWTQTYWEPIKVFLA